MRPVIFLFIFFLFIGLLVGANIYLPQRFAWYFGIGNTALLNIISVGITIFMIAGIIIFSNSISQTGSLLYRIAAITLGTMLYLLLSVLFVDLLHFFIQVEPRYYGIASISITILISIYGIWNAFNLKVTKLEIPVKGLVEEVRAMHLSDIHIGHFRGKDFLQKIVDKTNKQNPDVIFLTGDLFDGKIKIHEEIIEPLTRLKAPLFFVEGNHDGYSGVAKIKAMLKKNKIHVLANELVQWNGLQIVGLNHMLADHNSVNIHADGVRATIKSVLQILPIVKDQPSILLHHSPDGIQYASEKGIDLYLSGHTHAGQLFPINYISEWLFVYNRGLHNYNGTRIFVSQGAGTFGPPMRVATKSEITLVKLVPENK
jgi:predicted MPP superfamily phosphohydrolase